MKISASRLSRVMIFGFAAAALSSAGAAVVGFDGFAYANGAIAGQTGGTGWNYERTDEAGAPAPTASNWDALTGAPQVTGGLLVTNGTAAKREFSGATSGSAAGTNEREGAFRGAGVAYFSTTYSVSSLFASGTGQWGGLSSYDFDAERVFFGMLSQGTTDRFFGIGISGAASALSSIAIVAGQTYSLVAAVDFDNDLLKLWVNPNGADFDSGATSSADVSLAYTGTNWSTAVRLASAPGADVSWDNLKVSTAFSDAVPEPSGAVFASLGLYGLLLKRRRR
ncbi:MAG: hypothetical protein V4726_02750 [Verrucomicrobiota bacterium]